MNSETSIERLEQIVGERGRVSIERRSSRNDLPWDVSFDIENGGGNGYGTGRTLEEAVEDAIRDWETAA